MIHEKSSRLLYTATQKLSSMWKNAWGMYLAVKMRDTSRNKQFNSVLEHQEIIKMLYWFVITKKMHQKHYMHDFSKLD